MARRPQLMCEAPPTAEIRRRLSRFAITVTLMVFAWMRGQPEVPVDEWYGGADLGLEPGTPWPTDDVHFAREAAWADSVTHQSVLDRLETAHHKAISVIATLSADEWKPDAERFTTGVPGEHPWTELSNNQRLVAKATGCTYLLYDELVE